MKYIEPLPTCDAILHLFGNEASIISTSIYHRCGGKGNNIVTNAITKLISDGYLKNNGNSYFILGGDAISFINNGGYAGLCERFRLEQELNANKETEEKEIAQLNKDKIKIDIKNAKRIYKTYWLTFAIALGGLVLSIILLILKINEQTK